MAALLERNGIKLLICDAETRVRTDRDAANLVAEAFSNRAEWVVIPVECLDDDFFRLKTRIAGELIQKFVTYRRKLAIIGDISRFVESSDSLRDFVYEANRGNQFWFLPTMTEFEKRVWRAL